MVVCARASANKDSKEGMAVQDNKGGGGSRRVWLTRIALNSILIVFVHIAITPVTVVLSLSLLLVLLHIIIFGVVVVMTMIIISSSVAQ